MNQLKHRVLINLMGILFSVIGILLIAHGVREWGTGKSSLSWPTALGTIIESEVRVNSGGEGRPTFTPRVSYVYSIDGTEFLGTRIRFGNMSHNSRADATRIADRYTVGTTVHVAYLLRDPSVSVLEPGPQAKSLVVILAGLVFAAFGIPILIYQGRLLDKMIHGTPLRTHHSRSAWQRHNAENVMGPMSTARPVWSVSALIAANLVPIAGVVWLGWDVHFILLLYWTENLIIGCFTLLKLVLHRVKHPVHHWAKPFEMAIFYLHFGGFCVAHAAVLISFYQLGGGLDLDEMVRQHSINLYGWAATLLQHQLGAVIWPVAGLILSHGVSFFLNFIKGGEYQRIDTGHTMIQPYRRIVILQVALLAGAFLAMQLPGERVVLSILVSVKILLDVRAHLSERKAASAGGGPRVSPSGVR